MYIPKHFEETDTGAMHALIRARPLAALVTLAPGGLNANHIPLHLDPEPAPHGVLRGHVARANPIWTDSADDTEALAIFQGPDAYISPSWYATKRESGKVVPTWNYVAVHAYGRLRFIDDARWLNRLLEDITAHNESAFHHPWQVSDAPRDYTARLTESIIGVEMVITRLQGKWKVSQNQPAENRKTVIAGLRTVGTEDAMAMAKMVAAKGKDIR